MKVTKREVVPGFNYEKLVSQECFLSDGLSFEFLRQVLSALLNKPTSYKVQTREDYNFRSVSLMVLACNILTCSGKVTCCLCKIQRHYMVFAMDFNKGFEIDNRCGLYTYLRS